MLMLISLLSLNHTLLLLLMLTLTLKKGSAGSIHIHSRLVRRLTSNRGEKILFLSEENLFASPLLLVVHVTRCFFWQKKNKREKYIFLMRFFSDSLRGGTGTWTFSWNRNKNKQRYRQFVFKTSIVTQGKITTVKYFNKKTFPSLCLNMTSHQSSEDLLQPGHIVKVLIIPVIVIIMVVITVIVVVVNVINTVIFMVMSRSDGKWRERSVEVASARSTRASTSSPRSRLTNPFLKYKHPHWLKLPSSKKPSFYTKC